MFYNKVNLFRKTISFLSEFYLPKNHILKLFKNGSIITAWLAGGRADSDGYISSNYYNKWQLIHRKHTVGAHDCHMMGRRPDTVRLDQVSVGSDGTWIQHISESVRLHSTSTRAISTTRLQLQQKSATLQYKPHTSIWTQS